MRADRFEWLVPGLREELVTALIRSLPKELRRTLVPVPETAARVLARARPRRGPLAEEVAREIDAAARVPPEAWDFAQLPPHLRLTFRVVDDEAGRAGVGQASSDVRAPVRPLLRAELTAASSKLERTGETAWTIGTLPREVTLPGTGKAVRAYPALVDEGRLSACGCWRRRGRSARRCGRAAVACCCSTTPSLAKYVPTGSPTPTSSRCRRRRTAAGRGARRRRGGRRRRADRRGGGPAWDEDGFARLRDHVAGSLAETTAAVVAAVVGVLDAAREVRRLMEPMTAVPLQPARADVRQQSPPGPPGLRRRHGRRPAARTSSATSEPPPAGSSACRTPSPSTATA